MWEVMMVELKKKKEHSNKITELQGGEAELGANIL